MLRSIPASFALPCFPGFIWYPFGRDYLGPGVYILKGVPDARTPQNLPSIPFNLSLANWHAWLCGLVLDGQRVHAGCQ